MTTTPTSTRTPGRPRDAAPATAEVRQYLTFRLGDESYAMDIAHVREILRFETITRVPSTPTFIRGVINLRGRVVPVVDLGLKLGLPPCGETRWTCIVIVETTIDGEATLMGVMTDAVSAVVELAASDIEPPPPFGTQLRLDHLLGLCRHGDGFAMLLDVERVLSASELLVATAAASAAEEGEPEAEATEGPADEDGATAEPPAPESAP